MSTRRPARILLALAVVAVAAPTAGAQDQPAAHLTLLRQTPWNTPKEPVVELEVRATNEGQVPLEDLSLGITLWAAARTRTTYEESLTSDPVTSTITASTEPIEGAIDPGASRRISVELPLASTGVAQDQSLIYPLKLELRSGLVPVAVLRTPVVFLITRPRTPLSVAWAVVLAHPLEFGPDGTFRGTSLESALADGGSIAEAAGALDSIAADGVPIDLVVSPLLLMQLGRMSGGYAVLEDGTTRTVPAGEGGAAAAERTLATLRSVTASTGVELSSLPFAVSPLPSLLESGLGRDVPIQIARGRDAVSGLLLADPDAAVLRPPGSSLDEPTLERLARNGVELVLMDPDAVPPQEQPLGFAAPPTAALAAGDRTVTAVVTDAGVQDRLTSPDVAEDPVLAAQATLGELAVIWLEAPSDERAVALRIPELLPGAIYGPLLHRIADAPFLEPTTATGLARAFPPPDRATRLVTVGAPPYDPGYVDRIREGRVKISAYRSMLVQENPLPDQFETTLLLAEAGQFLEDPVAGRRLIASVHRTIRTEFEKVGIEAAEKITLTSSSGQIPLRVTNATGYPIRVSVELVSSKLSVRELNVQLQLDEPSRALVFHVEAKTTGQFPVTVRVRAPTGWTVAEETVVVRSTAYNRIALAVTAGAIVLLMLLWAGRLLRRRTS